jgi:hypothetical protein
LSRSCACIAILATAACHDVSSFTTADGGSYEGPVTSASFVRAGIGDSVRMCLTIDTSQLQGAPGMLSTSDGIFQKTPLRQIPQFWQDPLSTFNFGEGRIQNVLYVAHGNPPDGGASADAGDVFVIISFMTAGDIEVRLLRGAPGPPDAGSAIMGPPNLFGVFALERGSGTCPY